MSDTDLVERLRARSADPVLGHDYLWRAVNDPLSKEAADTVEQLREALSSRDAIIEGLRAELAKAISVKNRLQDNNSSMAEGWTAMLVRAEAAEARCAELTAALVRIALKDRHGRIVKPQEDGGFRGVGGMLAVFALTGKNGSFVLDKEIAEQYPAAFSALFAASSKEEGK